MKLDDLLKAVGEPEAREALSPYWEESLASYAGPPGFLSPGEYLENRRWCGLGPGTESDLEAAAAQIRGDPGLSRLAWHCRNLLFEKIDYQGMKAWPSLAGPLGRLGGVFYLLAAMDLVARVRAVHAGMSVPAEVTRETLSQVACFADNYRRLSDGRLGLPLNQLSWLRHYQRGVLFRLGRMEYMARRGPKGLAVEAYRHRVTGEVVALLPDGTACDREGFVLRDEAPREEAAWTARLERSRGAVRGCPVSPRGNAGKRPLTLAAGQWRRVLGADDPVLDMHIPAGGSMTPEACRDSLNRAADFFARFFPGEKFQAVTCSSWIFNPDIEKLALSSNNLARFQCECYLYPVPCAPHAGLWFIFLREGFDPASAPRETSLQRAVADFLAAGNPWRNGGMFFLLEDLPRFGTQVYRESEGKRRGAANKRPEKK